MAGSDVNRKVYHGIQVWYVPIDKTTGEYQTPIQWYGASQSDEETDGDTSVTYKDNKNYYVLQSTNERKLELEFAQMLPEFAIDCLGDDVAQNGVHGRNVQKYSAGAFMILSEVFNATQNLKSQLLEVYYHCTPSEVPTIENATNEDEITENPFKVTLSCSVTDKVKDRDGRPVGYYWIERTDANKVVFDKFKTGILKPTYASSSTVNTGGE